MKKMSEITIPETDPLEETLQECKEVIALVRTYEKTTRVVTRMIKSALSEARAAIREQAELEGKARENKSRT